MSENGTTPDSFEAMLDQLEHLHEAAMSQEQELADCLQVAHSEVMKLRAMLRAAGRVDSIPVSSTKAAGLTSKSPRERVSQGTIDKVHDAIKGLKTDPALPDVPGSFVRKNVIDIVGKKSASSVSYAIQVLRDEGFVRLAGHRKLRQGAPQAVYVLNNPEE